MIPVRISWEIILNLNQWNQTSLPCTVWGTPNRGMQCTNFPMNEWRFGPSSNRNRSFQRCFHGLSDRLTAWHICARSRRRGPSYGSTCPTVVWWVPWSESTSWGWSHHLWRHAPTTVFALCCMQIVLLTRSPGRFALSFLTAEFSTFWNLPTTNYSLNKTQFMKILRQKINSHRPASGLKSKTKRKMKMPKRMPLRMAKLLLINQMLTAWMRMMQIWLPQIQICLRISNTSSRGLWGNQAVDCWWRTWWSCSKPVLFMENEPDFTKLWWSRHLVAKLFSLSLVVQWKLLCVWNLKHTHVTHCIFWTWS